MNASGFDMLLLGFTKRKNLDQRSLGHDRITTLHDRCD